MGSDEGGKKEGLSTESRDQPDYNPIFESLVDRPAEGEETIIGIVAYALYKLAKREWISDFRERNGRPPTDAEVREYQKMWTPSLLEGKKSEAVQIIAEFSAGIVDKARPSILKEALRGSAWRATSINILSSFIYTLLVLGVVLVIAATGWDIPALLQKFGRLIQESR
jgi:hypothetical protein